MVFVRQLRGHAAPVAAVAINDLTGELATCAGTFLHVWTINGDEIANINTATGRGQQILCVSMSQMMDWDSRNVIMTGNSDGVVRMWSLEFVEVPDEKMMTKGKEMTNESKTTNAIKPKSEPQSIPATKRTSLSEVLDEESTAAERLQVFKDPDLLATKTVELGSSAESESGMGHYSRVHNRDNDISDSLVGLDVNCDGPNSLGMDYYYNPFLDSNKSDDVDSAQDVAATIEEKKAKDPQSPSADFVMVSDTEVKDAIKSALPGSPRKKNTLRDGFKWQKQLVFRSKLTMHTAFERKDNKDPAAVTALAVSRDHKAMFVGDAKGRVYSWSVTDQPGRVIADHWVKDDGTDSCVSCQVKFSFSERRHHCRNCGQLFCSRCSRFETEIRRLRILKPVRVCQACYNTLKAQQAQEALQKSSNNSPKGSVRA